MARTGSIGRMVVGVAFGMLVALGTLGMGAADVRALPKNVEVQNEWVNLCRENGGTPRRVGSRTVSCTFPNGNSITCNFVTLVCSTVVVTRQERAASASDGPLDALTLDGAVAASRDVQPVERPTTATPSDDSSDTSSGIVPID